MRGLAFVVGAVGWASAAVAEPAVVLNTLDWCPYTCENQADGGVSASIVRDAFRVMGYAVEFRFRPWQRAVREAQEQTDAAGYFPEYAESVEGFILSSSIGKSPLGLIALTGTRIDDTTPEGLAKWRIGIVSGYRHATVLNEAIGRGIADVEDASRDTINVRKVAAGRIDAAEIDHNVFNWLMRNDTVLEPARGRLAFGPTLEIKTLHVAFNNRQNGRRLAAVFAEGLKRVNVGAADAWAFDRSAQR